MAPSRTINVQRNSSLRRQRARGSFSSAARARASGRSKRGVAKRAGNKRSAPRIYKALVPAISADGLKFANAQRHPITCDPCKIPDGGTSESLAVKSTATAILQFPAAHADSYLSIMICSSPQMPIIAHTWDGNTSSGVFLDFPGNAKAIAESFMQYRNVCTGWDLRYTGNTVANEGVVRVFRGTPARTNIKGVPGDTHATALFGSTVAQLLTIPNAGAVNQFQNQSDSRTYSVAEITGGCDGIAQHHKSDFDYDGTTATAGTAAYSGQELNAFVDTQWTYTVIKIQGCAGLAPFYIKAANNVEGIVATQTSLGLGNANAALGGLQTDGAADSPEGKKLAHEIQKNTMAAQTPQGTGYAPMQ